MIDSRSHQTREAQEARLGDSPVWIQKRRLATALRDVIELVMNTEAPEDELRAATGRVERLAERLRTLPRHRPPRGHPRNPVANTPAAFFDLSPLVGLANPVAPPVALWTDGGVVRGRVVFGTAYQGPPSAVHGGLVAALFDEVLGFAQWITGNPGMTGTLKIRYRKPTPLNTELRFEATVERVEGRKIFTEGRLYDGDTVTADAEGVFISLTAAALQKFTTE
jgi:acyl-coenzyme A thioesterase PaaI-like protein